MGRAVRLKYVRRYRDRHGHPRAYYKPPTGEAIALPAHLPDDHPEFLAAYVSAATRHKQAPKGRTVNALVERYYQSHDYKGLRASTRQNRRLIYERLRQDAGDLRVDVMKPHHIRAMMASRGPAAGNNLLKCIRALTKLALDLGWLDTDPARDVRPNRIRTPGFHTWSEAEIAQFEERWPHGTRERLALELFLHTGQRKGDVVKMGHAQRDGDGIVLTQEKTGTTLWIPLPPHLLTLPEETPWLRTSRGLPFGKESFGNWFRKAISEAGLPPECSAHGLRKAAAVRLAQAGCTPHQIASITGHTSLKEIEVYTRAVDQRKMAAAAAKASTLAATRVLED